MRNLEVADLLYNISELLEIKGENPFKVRAYAKAARAREIVGQLKKSGFVAVSF